MKLPKNIQANKNPIINRTFQATYSGPIPPASEMEKYANISPDIPQKILQMALNEQNHRISMEELEQERRNKELQANIDIVNRDMFFAVLSILIIMASSVLCAYFGHPIASGIIGGGGIVIIVSVFVCGCIGVVYFI